MPVYNWLKFHLTLLSILDLFNKLFKLFSNTTYYVHITYILCIYIILLNIMYS